MSQDLTKLTKAQLVQRLEDLQAQLELQSELRLQAVRRGDALEKKLYQLGRASTHQPAVPRSAGFKIVTKSGADWAKRVFVTRGQAAAFIREKKPQVIVSVVVL